MSLLCSRCGRAVSENYSEEGLNTTNEIHISITNLRSENDADVILQDKEIKSRIVEARHMFENSELVITGRMLRNENDHLNSKKFSVASITSRLFKTYNRK